MNRIEELGMRVVRMPGVWRLRVLQRLARWGVREETLLILMAVAIGFAAAGAAWVFEHLVGLLQSDYFRVLAERFDLTGRWIILLPLLPAVGGIAVSVVRRAFGHERSALHGLSAVLLSLIRDRGRLKHTLGAETLLASSLTIGTGGSAGPEAPIAIIGSSVGSIIAALAGISRSNSATLVGCGAAAGISAVFDAPIAGVLFALEVMLRDFSVKTFTPIVFSAVIATTTFRGLHNGGGGGLARGLFEVPTHGAAVSFNLYETPNYLLLGLVCGVLAVVLTALMENVGHWFRRMRPVNPFFHPALGAGISGVCGVVLMIVLRPAVYARSAPGAGNWYVPIFASGYPTVMQALDPSAYVNGHMIAGLTIGVLVVLSVTKILATAFTLGSGGSGGVFAPSLFIGATAGGALGLGMRDLGMAVHPSAYALVGMGAVLAAIIQAPLMGIILLFELTRNYQIMLPIMLAAVTATVVYRLAMKESIYTLPLREIGVRLGAAVGMGALRRIGVDQLPLRRAPVAKPEESLAEIVKRSQASGSTDYVVLDSKGAYLGLLTGEDVRVVMLAPESAPLLLVGEVMRTNVPPLKMTDTLEAAWDLFARHELNQLVVLRGEGKNQQVEGMLARGDLMRRYHEELGA
ncbi:MAG TPA: chloride channel protein [Phycisphaerae bacterium]|nr:chloride channel protein [Phycisphaerae bacterium]